MNSATEEIVSALLLVASLGTAVVRPLGISEAVVAVPAAGVVVALGIVPADAATATLREIGPTVGFLAAILVFGHLCAEAGVFTYLGTLAAHASRGRPTRLLTLVVTLAAGITAVLTLDATVVLLTPVVLTTARQLRVVSRPHAFACTRLANSGSLLLPVSNLTNLLAFGASGLTFGRFAALMTLPWLMACSAEWTTLRSLFVRDLSVPAAHAAPEVPAAPRYALVVLAVTVAGFVVTSSLHVAPAWAAVAGCIALLLPRVRRRDLKARRLVTEASPGFCVFVLALAVIVDAVTQHGLGAQLRHVIPSGTGFLALLGLAAASALLANVVNNLPATLALIPLVTGSPALVLAMLVGVNVGPNATYPGSLATLLWRRIVPGEDRPSAARFHAIGLATVVPMLVVVTAALWASLQVF